MAECHGAPVMNAIEEPYDKKKRKRPMTAAQLAQLYAKLPRADVDSDDEPVRCPTPQHVRHARAAALEATAAPCGAPTTVVQFSGAQYSPRRDDRWRRELERALNTQQVNSHAYRPSNRTLFGEDYSEQSDATDDDLDGAHDPDRVVADPFYPDLTCTAAERDACLEDEQARRYENGLPLLVQNPADAEHWVDPLMAATVADAHTEAGDELIIDLPSLQATLTTEIVWSLSTTPASPPR